MSVTAEQLRAELTTLFAKQNQAGAEGTLIPATYLRVTVVKG